MRRQMPRKELENGSHHPMHLFFMRILATFCICLAGSSYAITCHCLNDAQCNQDDGRCPNGCEQGWHGPGCQIGNVAFRKPANQSTTYDVYTADKAVDGVRPQQGDNSERNCSHTVQSKSNVPHWWYVSLSESEDFVIRNITIVNRQGPDEVYLNNFHILYTSETAGLPDLTTWKHCTQQPGIQRGTIVTYVCNSGTAIGRRVAVYLTIAPEISDDRQLVLCEVIVNGYAYQEMSMFQNTTATVESSCNSSRVQLANLPVVPPTFLIVHLNSSKGIHGSRMERIRNVGARSLTFLLLTMANAKYNISVAPETCCIGLMCLNDEAASIERSKCVVGPSTFLQSIDTPQYQKYSLKRFGNFLNLTMLGTSPCLSTNTQINCDGKDNAGSLSRCTTQIECTLDPRHNHTCLLQLTYSDGFVNTSTSNFSIGATFLAEPKSPRTDVTYTSDSEQSASDTAPNLATIAGASTAAIVGTGLIVLAVILKCRKMRRAQDVQRDRKQTDDCTDFHNTNVKSGPQPAENDSSEAISKVCWNPPVTCEVPASYI